MMLSGFLLVLFIVLFVCLVLYGVLRELELIREGLGEIAELITKIAEDE